MAKYTIDRGTTANDGTGDNLRDGANKVNLNFDEIYTAIGDGTTLSAVTASSTTTFTGKTIDANGTGNSITNLEVADLASGVLDTDITSVSGSDDTLASAKAIKTYVDAQSHLSLIDEDNFATDSATRPPSQQSVKAYADTKASTGDATSLAIALG